MKVLLDVKDSKADFVMELLNNLSFVKAKPLSRKKEKFLKELKEGIENVKLVKEGKLKSRSLNDLLDEL
jgi:hypothetical protein